MAMLLRGLALRGEGKTNSPLRICRSWSRIASACGDNGTRCCRPDFMRGGGMVQTLASKSISAQRAPNTSPERPAVQGFENQRRRVVREPRIPIPGEITRLTGITAQMVAGKSIDERQVNTFIAEAVLIIAHNAAFDRPFTERSWDAFAAKHWACSVSEVDWRACGHTGTRLGYLLNDCRLFHDGHRALDDCRAVLEILSRPLPPSTDPPLKTLVETARMATVRIWQRVLRSITKTPSKRVAIDGPMAAMAR